MKICMNKLILGPYKILFYFALFMERGFTESVPLRLYFETLCCASVCNTLKSVCRIQTSCT
jgi:hypothetical protein